MYTLSCVKQTANGSCCIAQELSLVLSNDLQEGMGCLEGRLSGGKGQAHA